MRTARIDLARVPAPPTSTIWSTPFPPVSSRASLVPVGCRLVIDTVAGAQLECLREFLVAARGRDHPCARQPRKLKREQRHPARALNEDRVTRFDASAINEGVPGGHARARQGGGFLEGEVRWDTHQAVLRQHGQLGQQAEAPAAQRRPCFFIVGRPVHPIGHETGDHPVAGWNRDTPGPMATTSPAPSEIGTIGSFIFGL